MADGPAAADGVPIPIRSGGQQRLVSWHPPPEPPDGTPYGAEGLCVTADGDVVVISPDGAIWDLPAARLEPGETWEQTPAPGDGRGSVRGRRRGQAARLHSRSVPHRAGTWHGARPVCMADEVELRPWEARLEIADRRVVPPAAVEESLSLGSRPFAAIIRCELAEAAPNM